MKKFKAQNSSSKSSSSSFKKFEPDSEVEMLDQNEENILKSKLRPKIEELIEAHSEAYLQQSESKLKIMHEAIDEIDVPDCIDYSKSEIRFEVAENLKHLVKAQS